MEPYTHSLPDKTEVINLPEQYIEKMADAIAGPQSLHFKPGDNIVINCDQWGRQLHQALVDRAVKVGATITIADHDPARIGHLLTQIKIPNGLKGEEEAVMEERKAYIQQQVNEIAGVHLHQTANKAIALRGYTPGKFGGHAVNEELESAYWAASAVNRGERARQDWIVILMPTPEEAELIGMDLKNEGFEKYLEMFLKAGSRDWERVFKEQSKLIEKLSKGEILEVEVNDPEAPEGWRESKLTINIKREQFDDIQRQPWANSMLKRNFPGSEVFTGPTNTEGTWIVNGRVFIGDILLEGIKLKFENNATVIDELDIRVPEGTDYTATLEKIKAVFQADEGARHVGEIGIGTNPEIKGPQVNGVLAEKQGFHLGIGRSYSEYIDKPYPTYTPLNKSDGTWVNIDNGVRSAHHIDIAASKRKGLTMRLDGELLSVDGVYVRPDGSPDPDLAYLSVSE